MAAHARLKNEFTEDEKCHNLMTWLICRSTSSMGLFKSKECFYDISAGSIFRDLGQSDTKFSANLSLIFFFFFFFFFLKTHTKKQQQKKKKKKKKKKTVSLKGILHYVSWSFGLVRSDKVSRVIPRKSWISKTVGLVRWIRKQFHSNGLVRCNWSLKN